MAVTGLSILASMIVLHAFHHNPDYPVPHSVRVLVLSYIAKICMFGDLNTTSRKNKIAPSENEPGADDQDDVEESKLQSQKVRV